MSQSTTPRQGGRITLPIDVRAAERAYIHGRRTAGSVRPDAPLVGLAFSGGGIRSATFCLGVVQALGRSGLLRAVDYLSTVSGGGYVGSCLSSYLSHHRDDRAADASAGTPEGPRPWPAGARSLFGTGPGELPFEQPDPLHHLRTHGDFLILRNSLFGRDVLRVVGILGSGLFASLTLFACVALAIVALVNAYLFAFGGDALWQLLGPGDQLRDPGLLPALLPSLANAWASPLAVVVGLGALFAALTWTVQVLLPPKGGAAPGETGSDRAERLRLQRTGLALALGVVALACALPYPDFRARLVALAGAPADHVFARHGAHSLWLPVAFCLGFALTGVVLYVSLLPGALKRAWTLRGRSILGATVGLGLYGTLLTAVLAVLPLALWHAEGLFDRISITTVVSLLATRMLAAGNKPAQGALAAQLVALAKRAALALVVPVFLAASCILISRGLLDHVTFDSGPFAGRGAIFVWLLSGIATLAICGYAVDFNRVSPHYFYRDRLSEAYLRSERRGPDGLQLYRDDSYMLLRELHGRAQDSAGSNQPAAADSGVRVSGPPPDLAQYLKQPLTTLRSTFRRDQQEQVQVEQLRADLRRGYQQLRELRERPPEQAGPRYATWGADQYELARSAWGIVQNQSPYHLIVTALNLAGSRDLARRDLKSDHFVLSRLYCGSTTTGYVPTDSYNQGQTRLSQAMTISGAAASAAMGAYTFFAQAFAMTLFNIRLGYWLPNPNRYPSVVPQVPGARLAPTGGDTGSILGGLANKLRRFFRNRGFFWPRHLLIEMFSQTDARGALVNLSDGGHTADNVALYPLLQRRCELIIACDAGCDPQYTCADLAAALRQIFVDENVVSRIDTAAVVAQGSDARSRAHFAIGEISYPQVEGDPDGLVAKGYLIYLKSSLTDGQGDEREPLAVRAYRATSPEFPHESTADQFFSDDQFEAYRSLGQHAAGTLIAHLRKAGLGASDQDSQIWSRVLAALPDPIREQLTPPRIVTTSDVQELGTTGTG